MPVLLAPPHDDQTIRVTTSPASAQYTVIDRGRGIGFPRQFGRPGARTAETAAVGTAPTASTNPMLTSTRRGVIAATLSDIAELFHQRHRGGRSCAGA
jgi:hypothetical protein